MFSKYYQILGLKEGTSKEDIKNAYRHLAKKFHPDVSDEENAHEHFIEISEAYEILTNRKVIDDLQATSDAAEQQYTYEYFIKQARERLRNEHEAFQKSGAYDLMLLLEYILNYFLVLLTLFLIIFPVYLSIQVGFFGLFFLWIPGIFMILYIKGKGKSFFLPGAFFYNIDEIKQVIKDDSGSGSVPCQYCKNKPADAYPYKLSLLKVHDINLHFAGVLQHRASYKRSYQKLQVPRCKKAYKIHTAVSLIKLLLIITAILVVPFDSILWRIISGVFAGSLLSGILLAITGIRSKVSYLLNVNILVKILSWCLIFILFTDFSGFPNIITSDYIIMGTMLMLFFQDMLIDPIVGLFTGKGKRLMPLLTQPESLNRWYLKGYQPYLEIPVWSTIFPLLKWLF